MTRLRRAAAIALIGVWLIFAGSASAESTHVTFLHLNDVYELLPVPGKGGLAEAATLIRAQRARDYNTIVTFGGDLLSPSAMSGVTEGRQMIDMLNSIGVDYATFGNHEFDFGPDILRQRIAESSFEWLATSTRDDDGKPFGGASALAIRRIGRVTLGFFAVLSPDTAMTSSPGPHVTFLSPIKVAGEAVKALRASGVDVVIALTHESVDADKELVREVPGIDLVLGGDEHTPVTIEEQGVPIIKAGTNAEFLAVVDLAIDKTDAGVKVEATWHLQPTLGARPNAKLQAKIKTYTDDFDRQLAQRLATTDTGLDSREETVRTAESSMGDVIAEALLQASGADIAIVNGGGIRGDKLYPAGSVLARRDVQAELPFNNNLAVVELSGADILIALENGVSKFEARAGRFPQVAGLAFVFDPKKPVGQRIVSASIGGTPLNPKRLYKVATNDFMARGGDGYYVMAKAKKLEDASEGHLLTQIVADYFSAKGTIGQQTDGRIRQGN
jgi:5'-nucleotidase / UDP-sugar diphosphatase